MTPKDCEAWRYRLPTIARIWSELQMRHHWCWERWPEITDREAELY